MNRPSWKSLVFAVVIVAALFAIVDQANAWSYGGCCGGPAYGYPVVSAWDYGYYGGGLYAGVRPGPVRRLVLGPYRWYGGWYGAWGCCRPVYSCCTPTYSCCGEITSCCYGDYLTPAGPGIQPTPAKKAESPTPAPGPNAPSDVGPTPAAPAPSGDMLEPGKSTSGTPETSGILTVWVPYDAKVTINGRATKSTGSRRQFVSYELKEGFSYKYEVTAEVVRDGKIIEDTKTAILTAGVNTSVAFGFNTLPAEGLAAN
jgi:uncharacterized protein (TIGR03000 family)